MLKEKICKNCNSELVGLYCSECGQKNTELLSVKAIVKELTDNVFSFDSRFFITLKYLMIKPGFLTKEYWAGRRTTYLPPLRMYLVLSVFYFFLHSIMNEGLLHIIIDKSPQNNPKTWALNTDGVPQIFHFIIDNLNKGIKVTDERGLSKNIIGDFMPSAMFILMPFMGLLLLFVYKKKKLFYSYHLITVLHFHCFVFFLNSVEELIPIIDAIIPLFFFYYAVSMLKVIYQDSWVKTSMKFMMLLVTYGTVVLLTSLAIIFGSIFVRGLSA
ncbi:uncharacterized protein METZ01_LOCUS342403 [marine metagenome]|uniref:DUF3667 domain-containing protein n=1 Tax=marine metagenome TaxID=408172 RepID=A0A382QVM6_9ZZZZ